MRLRVDAREDPRTLGLMRIGVALCVFGDFASLLPHVSYLYGDAGVAPAATRCGGELQGLSLLCLLPGEGAAALIFGLGSLAALALALGLWTRVTKWIALVVLIAIVLRNPLPLAGQQVLGSFLFLLCVSRCGAAYSLDNLRRCRRLRAAGRLDDGDEANATYRPIPAWPRWLMILQLTVAYTVAGWAKTGPSYVHGDSFFNLLANDRWHRFPPWGYLRIFGDNMIRVATWTAWWFERLFPLAALGLVLHRFWPTLPRWLTWPTSRWIWATLACAFTGTLILLANLGWFVPTTLVATLALFRGDEVGRVVDRLLRRRTPPAPASSRAPAPAWRRGLLIAFIAWHSLAMLINALNHGHLKLDPPQPLARAAHLYKSLTGSLQFWWMFAPNAPGERTWLLVDVIDADGARHPSFDDRALIGERRYPYVLIDRRQKIHGRIAGNERWQIAHADHLCRTWRDPSGRPPTSVELRRRRGPTPSPEELATIPPGEEAAVIERAASETTLLRRRCDP
ncbi:MAG: HTTM domain-containing protein [Myxococcales bacterium]|nr:HTTM domain-containing protein [Myxococcales bacterium]